MAPGAGFGIHCGQETVGKARPREAWSRSSRGYPKLYCFKCSTAQARRRGRVRRAAPPLLSPEPELPVSPALLRGSPGSPHGNGWQPGRDLHAARASRTMVGAGPVLRERGTNGFHARSRGRATREPARYEAAARTSADAGRIRRPSFLFDLVLRSSLACQPHRGGDVARPRGPNASAPGGLLEATGAGRPPARSAKAGPAQR
jgi:hypothetical protein